MTCESDRSTASTESGQSTAASSEEVACLADISVVVQSLCRVPFTLLEANLEPATSLHHLTGLIGSCEAARPMPGWASPELSPKDASFTRDNFGIRASDSRFLFYCAFTLES